MAHESIRKVYSHGKAKAMTIPDPWIRYQQHKVGKKLQHIKLIMHEDRLELFPVFEEVPAEQLNIEFPGDTFAPETKGGPKGKG